MLLRKELGKCAELKQRLREIAEANVTRLNSSVGIKHLERASQKAAESKRSAPATPGNPSATDLWLGLTTQARDSS